MGEAKLRADVLDRFLALQHGVVAVTEDRNVASYCRRAVQHVPGVADAWVCLDGRIYPEDERISQVCETACTARDGFMSIDTSDVERSLGVQVFPMEGPRAVCGLLIVKPEDPAELETYQSIIGGFASFVGSVLTLREARRRLTEENITLRGARMDLQDRINARDSELEFSTTHDQLTGLPNRLTLDDRLNQALSYARSYGLKVAVAYINLDGFEHIRRSYGYAASDEILKIVAQRLRAICRDNDTVARLPDDHFAMVVTGHEESDEAVASLSHALAAVRRPMVIRGRELVLTCTIGCSQYPGDGETAEALLQRASIASYRGQHIRRDRLYFFAEGDDQAINDRAELESDLRLAIEKGQLFLHYQPKVDLLQQRYVGVEALLRWNHPLRGLVSPSTFIPIAEETGAIFEIGEWALVSACRQALEWQQRQGIEAMCMAVNLSARQLHDGGTVEAVRRALAESGLPANLLELEITESSIMHGVEQALPLLHDLKDLGVALSIDDFGTGYSNLNYLRRLPVDRLKIDRSLVHEVESVESAGAIARGVIGLGHTLKLKVVAEGVESVEQARFLRDSECDEAQGFLISRPLPADAVAELLASGPSYGGMGGPGAQLRSAGTFPHRAP